MIQVLYEKGDIDTIKVVNSQSMSYSKIGEKKDMDENDNIKDESKQFSLTHLFEQCHDFNNKMSDMKHLCADLSNNYFNIKLLFTPKYHCKLAGEGIEYSWGGAKCIYRRYPMSEKSSFVDFVNLVNLP